MKPVTSMLLVVAITLGTVNCGEPQAKQDPEVVRYMERYKSDAMFNRMGKEEKKRYLESQRYAVSVMAQDSKDKEKAIKAIDTLLKELEK